ncbi:MULTISPECIES: hypothetical protein [Prauserella salsuginis group]|uniref:Uncharacterized protein n=1 Tax=Prauserella salsuginis TaxID=387889 RepID=A0ABW6G275_9PSEU|nr:MULTISPECIES: hypothetical protein [Prauserella salsuginis group]MCR3719923.1 hypothetical protein [Prauserella flava]MCR3736533.1 hypothetical protein [Prauserella salsuginis]
MSSFDVLARYGTGALLRFAAAVALFLVLHLIRIPLVLAARVLEVGMRRADGFATRQASQAPDGPINHFFAENTTTSREDTRVYA